METHPYSEKYSEPGTYTITVPSPQRRQFSTLTLEMVNEHGQLYCDSMALSFNVHFFRLLKWCVVTYGLFAYNP